MFNDTNVHNHLQFWKLSQMSLEVLGHSKSFLPFFSKDGFHFLVWSEPLFVLRVLQLVFLEVGPDMLDNLRPGHLLHLQPEQINQVLGQLQWFGEAGSFWHFDGIELDLFVRRGEMLMIILPSQTLSLYGAGASVSLVRWSKTAGN